MADSNSVSSIFIFTNILYLSPSISLWFDNYFLCLPSSALDFILFLIYHYPSSFPWISICFSDSILSFVTIIDWSWIEFYLHLAIDYFGTLISISLYLNSVFFIVYCALYRVFSISILLVRFDQYTHLLFFFTSIR